MIFGANYRILKLLKEKKIKTRIRAKDVLLEQSKRYLINVAGRTIMEKIPEKLN
ncbi:MAG: hypothetical protein QXU18_06915 [Thermoplasmatales archaeon]